MTRLFILICLLISFPPVFAQRVIPAVDTVRAGTDSAYYYARKADALMTAEKYLPAYGALTHALHFDHTESRNYYNRTLCLAHLEHYSESLKDLNKALELKPDEPVYWSELGSVHYLMNNYNAALTAYEHALKLGDHTWHTYSDYFETLADVNRYERLISESKKLERHISMPFPGEDGAEDVAFYTGLAYHQTGDWNNALRWYNEAIRLSPDYAGYYNNRGDVLRNMKKYSEAILDFNKSIELAPDQSAYYYVRGIQYLELRAYAQALKDLVKAESLGDTDKELYLSKGNTLRGLHRMDEALAAYNKALAIDGNFRDAYDRKASLLESMKHHAAAVKTGRHKL
ncbi:tetratricopeptide repeat protein [Chitinophagaceae bacterium MMS25-I14]